MTGLIIAGTKAPLGQFSILGSSWSEWTGLGFFLVIFWFPESGFKSPGCKEALRDTARTILTRALPERQLLWNLKRCVSDKTTPTSPACSLFEVASGQKWALSTGLIWVLLIQGLVCFREGLQFPHWESNRFAQYSSADQMPTRFREQQDNIQMGRENQRWADLHLHP